MFADLGHMDGQVAQPSHIELRVTRPDAGKDDVVLAFFDLVDAQRACSRCRKHDVGASHDLALLVHFESINEGLEVPVVEDVVDAHVDVLTPQGSSNIWPDHPVANDKRSAAGERYSLLPEDAFHRPYSIASNKTSFD